VPRRRGVPVRAGTVRAARSEAGLTLQQLAGIELTKQALSLVERGRARPSLNTLRLISRRTGKPIDYFLEGPLPAEPVGPELDGQLAELERLTAVQGYAEVLQVGAQLLETAPPGPARGRVQLCLGEAYVRLFKPALAVEHLGPARASFEEIGDTWQVVECMNWEANALYLQQDPAALELAVQALDLCRQLDPVPTGTELRLMTNLANMHAARHEWSQAVRMCEDAIALADSVHDLGRMARMHYCLGVSYRNLGDTGRAMAHVQRAMALHEFVRDDAQKARVQNTLGLLLLQMGDLEGAERSMRSSLDGYEAAGQESGRSRVLTSLAELHMARGQHAEAENLLSEALNQLGATGERMSEALGHQLLGAALDGQDRHQEADREFERALEMLKELKVRERLVECHAAYAAVLEARGDTDRARQHWKLGLLAQRPELGAARTLDARSAGSA
jgi:tetratricopeptide (TPR) repeat protein